MTLLCILCGSRLTLIDRRNRRGYCPKHNRHVTAVTEAEYLAKGPERVREALA